MKPSAGQFLSLARVRLVALQAVREALHLRIAPLFFAFALAPVVAVGWLREFNFGTAEIKFIIDLGHGALSVGGTLLAVLATVQLVHGELAGRTVQMLLTRPLTLAEFLSGKLLGLLALMTWFAAGLAMVLALVALWRGRASGADLPWTFLLGGVAFIWLKLVVTVALTMLVCTYARSGLFAAGVGLLLVMLAHLRHLAGTAGGWSRGLTLALPDFQLFDPERLASVSPSAGLWVVAASAAYAAAYLILYTVFAGWLLQRREY